MQSNAPPNFCRFVGVSFLNSDQLFKFTVFWQSFRYEIDIAECQTSNCLFLHPDNKKGGMLWNGGPDQCSVTNKQAPPSWAKQQFQFYATSQKYNEFIEREKTYYIETCRKISADEGTRLLPGARPVKVHLRKTR